MLIYHFVVNRVRSRRFVARKRQSYFSNFNAAFFRVDSACVTCAMAAAGEGGVQHVTRSTYASFRDLMAAVGEGDLEAVKRLMADGVDANVR